MWTNIVDTEMKNLSTFGACAEIAPFIGKIDRPLSTLHTVAKPTVLEENVIDRVAHEFTQ
jgi:hypothetical protein